MIQSIGLLSTKWRQLKNCTIIWTPLEETGKVLSFATILKIGRSRLIMATRWIAVQRGLYGMKSYLEEYKRDYC